MKLKAIVIAMPCLVPGGIVNAQCVGQWLPWEGAAGAAGGVSCMATWDRDGTGPQAPVLVVASGTLTVAGTAAADNVAYWDGASWAGLGHGFTNPNSTPEIRALRVYNGELVAAGNFITADGQPAFSVVRWDGTAWRQLGPGYVGRVYSLAEYHGELVAAGLMTAPSVTGSVALIAWNGSQWHALGDTAQTVLRNDNPNTSNYPQLEVYNDELIIGGGLFTVGGVSAGCVLAWNGTVWHALGSGLGATSSPTARALTVHDGRLIVGGSFQTAGGVPVSGIAAWDGSWHAIGNGFTSAISTLGVHQGTLFAGGGASTTASIWSWDGATWNAVPGYFPFAGPSALVSYGGDLVGGGGYIYDAAHPSNSVARWTGTQWAQLGTGGNFGTVNALMSRGGDLYVGGRLYAMGGQPVSGIARWGAGGWNPLPGLLPLGIASDASVLDLCWDKGTVVAVGSFKVPGTPVTANIARWDGQAWNAVGAGLNSSASAVLKFGDYIIAGGLFTVAGGNPAEGIARWDGGTWESMTSNLTPPPLSQSVYVSDLIEFEGKLIACGLFTVGGNSPNIAMWNGFSWQPMSAGFDGNVNCLAIHNGSLMAGGSFSHSGTTTTSRVARWNGTTWVALGGSPGGGVNKLLSYNGELYATGGIRFSSPNGLLLGVSRWDGTAWRTVDSGLNDDGYALAEFQGKLIVGGRFTRAGSTVCVSVAQWAGCPTCAANCDGSTASPILNVADFGCFMQRFQEAMSLEPQAQIGAYANCDGSTASPVLTVNDFQCFMNTFAAGCP